MVARTVRREIFEPLFRLVHRRQMTGRNPPHDEMRSFHLVEPFLAAAVEALVHGLPHVALKRFDAFPHRQIDRHLRIGERPKIGGVAAVVLQPPDKPLAALGQAVHQIEIVHEIGHARIVGRIAQAADIELREMSDCVHRSHSAATADRLGMRVGGVFVDAPLDLRPEMPQQALHRPGRAVAEGADGVAFDLGRDFHQHVDLALVRAAFGHALEHAPHPAHALAARRALAAALVLVEIGNARHRPHDVGRLVHDDHGGGAERRFLVAAAVEIHQQRVGLIGPGGHERHRRAAGDHREQIVPAAAHAAGVLLDQFAQRNAHLLFDSARPLDVAGNAIELGAGIVRPADAGEPGRAAPHDVGHLRDGLDIVDGGRAAVEAHIGRERRLEPRHALLAFEAFEQRRLLAADIGAGAVVHDDVEVEAVDVVLADELGVIGLLHGGFEALALADEFAADVDVAGVRRHGAAGDQAALDQKMRIVPHDLAVLAGAGLRTRRR